MSEFTSIARSLYVEIASREFGIRGRPTNKSRIALLTGLSRAQVKSELDALGTARAPANDELTDGVRHASRVLLGWYTDKRFVDADGVPRPLHIDDPDGFPALYEDYSGKVVPATSLLKELIGVGAVESLPDGRVVARARSYTPTQTNPQALFRIGLAISDLATTAHHNLHADAEERRRFERFATNQLIDERHVADFNEFLNAEAQAFLERADDWLTQREEPDGPARPVRVGVGVYEILTEPTKTKR